MSNLFLSNLKGLRERRMKCRKMEKTREMSRKRSLKEETCDSDDESQVAFTEPDKELQQFIKKCLHPYEMSKRFNSLPKDDLSNLINWSKMTQSDSTSYRVKAAAIFCSV